MAQAAKIAFALDAVSAQRINAVTIALRALATGIYEAAESLDKATSVEAGREPLAGVRPGLDAAIKQREATPGMPQDGPYPATTEEVADEIVAWIKGLDESRTAGDVLEAVGARLNAEFDWREPHRSAARPTP